MQLQIPVSVLTLALGALASPVPVQHPAPPPGQVELWHEDVDGGHFVWYGDANANETLASSEAHWNETIASSEADIDKREGACYDGPAPEMVCDDVNHLAHENICEGTLARLSQGPTKYDVLAPKPRSFCYHNHPNLKIQGFCCVSWSKPVYGMTRMDLYNAAMPVYKACLTKAGMSGKSIRTTIRYMDCLNVCVSNWNRGC